MLQILDRFILFILILRIPLAIIYTMHFYHDFVVICTIEIS